ncbi:unnamed protein product [Ectocarpus sp. CCAP 1310/34]|nr:unnamed protein product [Ectocarpus sp. CCAP 1310/34]
MFSSSGPARDSCLNAIIVALNETSDGKSWYTSTKERQLASLEFCIACRNHQTLDLKVDSRTPRRLLAAADAPPPHPKRLCGTRVPRLRARRVTWDIPTAAGLRNSIYSMMDADSLEFVRAFEDSLEAVAWPRRLKTVEVSGIAEVAKFHDKSLFDQPIAGVVWPDTLEQLTFGLFLNQPIEWCTFPASLEELSFGAFFRQPMEDVTWPASLNRLDLGCVFNRPVDNVKWPASLAEVCFGVRQEVLGDVVVTSKFNRPIGASAWPKAMHRLTLGQNFRQSLQELGTWMPNLETFHLLHHIHDSGTEDSFLRGIEWPKGLRQLAVCRLSSLAGVVIPSTVEACTFKRIPQNG